MVAFGYRTRQMNEEMTNVPLEEPKSNSSGSGSFAEFDAQPGDALEGAYFRAREFDPQYSLLKEEPQHRVICILAAEGYTNKEIAEKTEFTTAMVAYVKKQPWALAYMAKMQGKAASGAMKILTGAAAMAAEKLVAACEGEIMGLKVKHEVQVKAANDILNRVYGTAPQLVMHGKVDPKELTDEELAQMLGQSQ